jgi:hypothetical protein
VRVVFFEVLLSAAVGLAGDGDDVDDVAAIVLLDVPLPS